MKITRNVVADLLPLYLAGEVSADTRALVEEYLAGDADMRDLLSRQSAEPTLSAVDLPPDHQLRTLRQVRRSIARQRWVFGLATFFSAMALTTELSFEHGRLVHARLLLSDSPAILAGLLVVVAVLWFVYFRWKRLGR